MLEMENDSDISRKGIQLPQETSKDFNAYMEWLKCAKSVEPGNGTVCVAGLIALWEHNLEDQIKLLRRASSYEFEKLVKRNWEAHIDLADAITEQATVATSEVEEPNRRSEKYEASEYQRGREVVREVRQQDLSGKKQKKRGA